MSENKKTLGDYIAQAAKETGLPMTKVKSVLDFVFEQITLDVDKGADVRIHNFGTFSQKTRSARKGRNPSTGQEIDIAESKSMVFKATKHSK